MHADAIAYLRLHMLLQVQGVPTNPILPRAGGVIATELHLERSWLRMLWTSA